MNIIVQKYGGSSLMSSKHILKIAEKIALRIQEDPFLVIIVSAMGKTTNEILKNGELFSQKAPLRETNAALVTGEMLSAAYLSMALTSLDIPAISLNAFQAGLITDKHHPAKILSVDTEKIISYLKEQRVVVIPGFQGINEDLEFTTLGRGGSDTSAMTIAAFLKAKCEIYTDVDGFFTADPREIHQASLISHMQHIEASILAEYGAKIMHSPACKIAEQHHIPYGIFNSHIEKEGTLIDSRTGEKETTSQKNPFIAITSIPIIHALATSTSSSLDLISFLSRFQMPYRFLNLQDSSYIFIESEEGKNAYQRHQKDILEGPFHFQEKALASVTLLMNALKQQSDTMQKLVDILKGLSIPLESLWIETFQITIFTDPDIRIPLLEKLHKEFFYA